MERSGLDDQGDAIQAEMAVGRPTAADPEFPHDGQPVSISQGEILIGELFHDASRFGQCGNIETSYSQAWQGIDECQELYGSLLIVAAKEPSLPFNND